MLRIIIHKNNKKNSLGTVNNLALIQNAEFDLLTGSPACFSAIFHFSVAVSSSLSLWVTFPCLIRIVFCHFLFFSPSSSSRWAVPPARRSSDLEESYLSCYPSKGRDDLLWCYLNPSHQFSEKKALPSIVSTKRHKFPANKTSFFVGSEAYLRGKHLLTRVF